ncbi:MAG: BamA/TamA family outer membrane protein [Myxococcales bacterium]
MNCVRHLLVALALVLVTAGSAEAKLVVGNVVLHDASKTREETVRSLARLELGSPVDYGVLQATQERLEASDLFESADAWVDLPREEATRKMYLDEGTEPVDVHVRLKEKQSWFAVPMGSLGAGDMAIGAAFADVNLAGRGTQLLFAGQYGESKTYLVAGVRQPQLPGAPIALSLSGVWRLEDFNFYENHRKVLTVPTRILGVEAQGGWVATPNLRLMVGILYNRHSTFGPKFVDPTVPTPAYNTGSGNVVVGQFLLQYDDTSAPQGLRRGTRFSLRNEISDGALGSDFDYLKVDLKLELFGQWWKTYPSLALHFLTNHPTSQRGVPLTQLLRAGGNELRGFNTWEFRGDTILTLQLEEQMPVFTDLKVPLTSVKFNLAAAVFADGGVILERQKGAGTGATTVGQNKVGLHAGVGVGVRVVLPGIAIPALKADFAYGIDVKDFAFTLSIAGGGIN